MQARQVGFEAFTHAWETQKKHIGIYAVGLLIFLVATWAVGIPVSLVFQGMIMASVSKLPAAEQGMAMMMHPMYWMSIVAQQLVGALVAPIGFGIARMALMSMRGTTPSIGQMFEFNGRYMNLVVYSIFITIIGSIGMALCFIPGLIVYALLFPGALLVLEQGMQPVEAIKKCFSEMTPSLGSLLGILIVCGLMAVLGAILCGIGIFFLAPVYFCCMASVYRAAGYDGDGVNDGVMPTEYYRPS